MERIQAEVDRLRESVHNLRSRIVVLEVTVKGNEATLKRLEEKVDSLARKDEIEDAIQHANQATRVRFWHTWQGGIAAAAGIVVLAGSSLTLVDRLF